ncbi:MAG: hypothetical protein QXZ49_03895 [Nitrososphaerota archaeon]
MRSYIIAAILVICVFILPIMFQPVYASTDTIKLLDSYWGSGGTRVEACPGDMYLPFTVVLGSDYEESKVSNILAKLYLPDGFSSTYPSSPNLAEATYLGAVPPGGIFEITFYINIGADTRIGEYTAKLDLTYDEVGEQTRRQFFDVRINLMGKSKIIFEMYPNNVEPGRLTPILLKVKNIGEAAASDVRVQLSQISNYPSVSLIGDTYWILDKLEPGKAVELESAIYANQQVSDTTVLLQAQAVYRNTVGQIVTHSSVHGIQIVKTFTKDIDIKVWLSGYSLKPNSESVAELYIMNEGIESAYDIRLAFNPPASIQVLPVGEPTSWTFKKLDPKQTAVIKVKLAISSAISRSVTMLPLTIKYRDRNGNQDVEQSFIALFIGEEEPKSPNILLSTSSSITAGKVETIKIDILNNYRARLDKVVIIASPIETGLSVIGSNNWKIDKIDPAKTESINVSLFASPSLAGSPARLRMKIQYVTSDNGETINEEREVGFIIEGFINLRVYDLNVIFLAGSPMLTGNILNEGNVPALFTTVEFESPLTAPGQTIYIGDLNPNAPLPFNVKLINNLISDNIRLDGVIIIKYKDELRREHVYTQPVSLTITLPHLSEKEKPLISQEILNLIIVLVVIIAIVGSVAILLRRRRHGASRGH